MSTSGTIDVSKLKGIIESLFGELAKAGVEHIDVPQYYRTVQVLNAFAADADAEATLGDLWDDLHDLKLDVSRPDDEVVIFWHASEHLAGLIKAIAYADLEGRLSFIQQGRV